MNKNKKIILIIFAIFFLLVLSIYSILKEGYYYGIIDNSLQVPLVNKIINPNLYKNDLAMNYFKDNFIVRIWWVIAFLSKYINLEILLFLLHLLSRFLLYLALFWLTKIITKKIELSYIAVLLLLTPYATLGGTMMPQQFIHSELVVPVLLFSLCLFLIERYELSFFLAGLAFYIHPQYAGYFLIMYLFFLFINIKKVKPSFIIYFVLFCLILPIPVFLSGYAVNSKMIFSQEWININLIRSPHHLLPSTWSLSVWIDFTIFFILWLISFITYDDKIIKKIFKYFYLAIMCFLVMGFLFTEVFPFPRLMLLFPFRISEFFIYFGLPFIILFIFKLLKDYWEIVLTIYLTIKLIFIENFYYILNLKSLLVIIICLGFTWVITKKFKGLTNNLRINKLSIFFLLFFSFISYKQIVNFIKGNDSKTEAYKNVQIWIKNNTSEDSLFIIPPYFEGFRVWSKRSQLADYKDGTVCLFSSEFTTKWWKIMNDLGISNEHNSNEDQKIIFNSFKEDKFFQLSNKYKANYLLTENNKKLNLPLLYGNDYYLVYLLNPKI